MELVGTLMVCCIAAFGLGNVIEDVGASKTFNVVDYGAVGDGETDDSQAFAKAWGDLCKATGGVPTLIVPAEKTFLLMPMTFEGLCNSSTINIQVEGNIVAPSSLSQWPNFNSIKKWLSFSFVNGLIINGGGQINGQGSIWWHKHPNDVADSGWINRPTAVHFSGCNDLQLSGLHHVNPPRNHISINNCKNVSISNVKITAPGDSPNTDGIDISGSSQINIQDSYIATGDDCIAINGNSSYINITSITCGPGHGISVGSLGSRSGVYEIVVEVYVRNCTLIRTANGARIKTWQGGSRYARHITFEQLSLFEVHNPIIIDQYYCDDHLKVCSNETSAVQISDVTYRNVNGSSVSEKAINLSCSESKACTNIVMDGVNIHSSVPGEKTFSFCYNAYGTSISTTPAVPCLYN